MVPVVKTKQRNTVLRADLEWLMAQARKSERNRGCPLPPQPSPSWPCQMRLTCPSGTNGTVLRVRCECMSGTTGPPSPRFHGWDHLDDADSSGEAVAIWKEHAAAKGKE